MRRPIKALLLAGLAIAVGSGIAYATFSHTNIRVQNGIAVSVDADQPARTIRFADGWNYIYFGSGSGNCIQAVWFGTECLQLKAGLVAMTSLESEAEVTVNYDGDVIITLGE